MRSPTMLTLLLASACAPGFTTGDWTADGGLGDVPADTGTGDQAPLAAALNAEQLKFEGTTGVSARAAFRAYADGGLPEEPALPLQDQCELREDVALPEGASEEAGGVSLTGLAGAAATTALTFDSTEGAYVLPTGSYTWPTGNITFDVSAGARVPAFQAQLAAPAPLNLTAPSFTGTDPANPVAVTVERGQALHVAWSGAAASELWLTLGIPGQGASPGKTLVCAPADDGSFDVPQAKVGLLPGGAEGFFALERRRKASVTATGVDRVTVSAFSVTKGVIVTSE